MSDVDIVLTTRSYADSQSKISHIMKGQNLPLHVIKRNSIAHRVKFFRYIFKMAETPEEIEEEILLEAQKACRKVLEEKRIIDLEPWNAFLRRIQHQVASEAGLNSMSVREDPNRRVRICPI